MTSSGLITAAIGSVILIAALCAVVFLICLVLAPPTIHSEQLAALRQSRESLDTAASELKAAMEQYRPGLKGYLIQAVMIELDENHQHEFATFFVMRIANTGDPSIASGFSVVLTTIDGRRIAGKFSRLNDPGPILLGEHEHTVVFQPEDALDQKCLVNPIPQGGQATGYLLVAFDGVSIEECSSALQNSRIAVRFCDALGKWTELIPTGVVALNTPGAVPGMSTVLRPPEKPIKRTPPPATTPSILPSDAKKRE